MLASEFPTHFRLRRKGWSRRLGHEARSWGPVLGLASAVLILVSMVSALEAVTVVRVEENPYSPTISNNSTSNESAAPPGTIGGAPLSPYAISGGQTNFDLPPILISATPSVQQGITLLSGNSVGSPLMTELSNTVPSRNVP
jgi:hypothetical protein